MGKIFRIGFGNMGYVADVGETVVGGEREEFVFQ